MASSYFYSLKIMPFPSFSIRNVGQYILTLLSPPSLNIEHHYMRKYIRMLKRWEKKIQQEWNIFRSMQNDGKGIIFSQ
jgi:hypothetical protein